jgi:RNase adaptor protein for sRNA GlmZ degradation
MTLVVLTGASGSGKTTIAAAIEAAFSDVVDVYYFDRIGVPSLEPMIADHGSPEAWQRAMVFAWWQRLAVASASGRNILFEGQMRLSFLAEAAAGSLGHTVLLVDCDDATRAKRLCVDRRQPELAGLETMTWADYLRREAASFGCDTVDTSRLSIGESVAAITAYFPDLSRPSP